MTQEQSNADPPCMFIVKPEAGCQGKGIFIVRTIEELQRRADRTLVKQQTELNEHLKLQECQDTAQRYGEKDRANENEHDGGGFRREHGYVVQKYIKYPALVKQHKFDFRIYVLITSVVDPMSIFLYKDGLVRLASEKYSGSKNMQDIYQHLTNYSLNKKNTSFDGKEHKLLVSEVLKGTMTQQPQKPGRGPAVRSSEEIWQEIESIVVKTVLTVQPQLQHIYRSCQQKEPDCCFELLGFDIMLDANLKPWMIEVNHTPSFNADTESDEQVKAELLKDTFDIV